MIPPLYNFFLMFVLRTLCFKTKSLLQIYKKISTSEYFYPFFCKKSTKNLETSEKCLPQYASTQVRKLPI